MLSLVYCILDIRIRMLHIHRVGSNQFSHISNLFNVVGQSINNESDLYLICYFPSISSTYSKYYFDYNFLFRSLHACASLNIKSVCGEKRMITFIPVCQIKWYNIYTEKYNVTMKIIYNLFIIIIYKIIYNKINLKKR